MSDAPASPTPTLPVLSMVRVLGATAVTVALTVMTLVPGWRVPHWEWVALSVVIALAACAAWACTRRRSSWPVEAWSAFTLVAVVAWCVAGVVGETTSAPFTPAAVTALGLLAAGEAERRSGVNTRVPAWWPAVTIGSCAVAAAAWTIAGDTTSGVTTGLAALVATAPGTARLAAPLALLRSRPRTRGLDLDVGSLAPGIAARLDTVVLQQHGTVTTGDLRVLQVQPVEPDHDRNLRWFAGALAHAHNDRVWHAVARLSARGRLSGVENVPGRGIRGSVDRHPVRLGSPDWIGLPVIEDLWTPVAVEVDGRPLGTLVLAEDTREHAAASVARLRALGIDVVLVSDDTRPRAEAVARAAGLEEVLLTDEGDTVRSVVDQLRHEGQVVAVVSDIAPDADLRIGPQAVGPAGIVTADNDVRRVVAAIRAARGVATATTRAQRVAVVAALIGVSVVGAGLAGPLLACAWAIIAALAVGVAAAPAGTDQTDVREQPTDTDGAPPRA
ncbi:HAD family hydrolase [Aeromicrobium sp. CF4.19]|uniref:HAD family hydrolase n=1 Tax=Aeromicrobium sp. CF4.19 TaxID=3373082 RepID=UPI003EE482AD